MNYRHILVPVAVSPESHKLVAKAVSIVKPVNGEITLITSVPDPEMYNQLAGLMMENIRDVMQEEVRDFLQELCQQADYPIRETLITYGELGPEIVATSLGLKVDLVLCGNHNQGTLAKLLTSAKKVIESSQVDVLLVPL